MFSAGAGLIGFLSLGFSKRSTILRLRIPLKSSWMGTTSCAKQKIPLAMLKVAFIQKG
jgi:hypothetical protein